MKTSRGHQKLQDGWEGLTDQLADGMRKGKYTWQELESSVIEKSKSAARATDTYLRQNLWISLAAAAVMGVIIGLTFGRRD